MKEIGTLWEEVRDLSLGSSTTIDHLDGPPDSLTFLRNYVSPNKPCLISNATHHWPALSLWPSPSYLSHKLSTSLVSLHLTPNGRADALTKHPNDPTALCFASAFVTQLPFDEALSLVSNSDADGDGHHRVVAYLQQQNDCFRSEYSVLGDDCDGEFEWASEAFGCAPEAVNLWIGNQCSETWWHKDHYENIYAVVSGEKHFLLLPPTDVHRMYIKEYLAARYLYDKGKREFTLELEETVRYVPWCSVDPYPSPEFRETEVAKYPMYFNGPKPFEVTAKAGDILYLPSMWFHHVRQSPDDRGRTIALNYWYDMQFDIKYAYFNFLNSMPRHIFHGELFSGRKDRKSDSDAFVIESCDE